MSKKNKTIKVSEQVISPCQKSVFVLSPRRKLISITDKALLFGVSISYPIMMDEMLWKMYHKKGSNEFGWLYSMLRFCNFIIDPNNTDFVEATFSFACEPMEHEVQFIQVASEMDELGSLYFLLKLNEGLKYQSLD